MRRADEDVLAYKGFPREHWAKIHSTNPLERLNKEIRRRTNVVGTFPNETAVTRLLGALMLEQNDEWAITRRYMTLKTVAAICDTAPMDPADIAALKLRPSQRRREKPHHSPGHYPQMARPRFSSARSASFRATAPVVLGFQRRAFFRGGLMALAVCSAMAGRHLRVSCVPSAVMLPTS